MRFVTAAETEQGKRLYEPVIKQITGNDGLTARFLYGEYFSFPPAFKLFMATNHKPAIKGTDYGIWRRIRPLLAGRYAKDQA
jgi:putative DNA primase/helicase